MHINLFIHCAQKLECVNTRDISLIEASGHYVKIITTEKNYLVTSSLTKLEEELPAQLFCRVHRSFIIPVNNISHIERDVIRVGNLEIPFAPKYKPILFSKIKVIW